MVKGILDSWDSDQGDNKCGKGRAIFFLAGSLDMFIGQFKEDKLK